MGSAERLCTAAEFHQRNGTVYAVRAFFKEDARENITDKVQRIILKSDDNNKEI